MTTNLRTAKRACLRALTPVRVQMWKLRHNAGPSFRCPICNYQGVFFEMLGRQNAACPKCGLLERHRLQWLVIDVLSRKMDFSSMKMLHFAPEVSLSTRFRRLFRSYETADLDGKDVDHAVDLTNLPFENASYDWVYVSHVLEHVREDRAALANIRRILKPGGIAILPVPIFAGTETVEYPEANPFEAYHVRQPGYDYFDRYKPFFTKIEFHRSGDYPPEFQTYIYEDRSGWPTPQMPYKRPMSGLRHEDIVPVCYA